MFGLVGKDDHIEPWELRELCDETQADAGPNESEMELLRRKLTEKGITWESMDEFGKSRTLYPGKYGTVAVICSNETYGGSLGLLEAWYPGKPHEGWLTSKAVLMSFPPIRKHGGGK